MSIKQIYIAIWVTLFFTTCKEQGTEIVPENKITDKRDLFVGDYQVKNEKDSIYQMKIEKLDSLDITYLKIFNFADKFTLLVTPLTSDYVESSPYNNQFSIGGYFPAIDKDGNRWALFGLADDALTTLKESYLINDSVIIWFQLSNIAFYTEDQVSYQEGFYKHTALKINK